MHFEFLDTNPKVSDPLTLIC